MSREVSSQLELPQATRLFYMMIMLVSKSRKKFLNYFDPTMDAVHTSGKIELKMVQMQEYAICNI